MAISRFPFEFHISLQSRKKYQFEESLFSLDGNVILADFAAARRFSERMSRVRSQTVPASDINAMGLIDEILHLLIRLYENQNPGAMSRALSHLKDSLGGPALDAALQGFVQQFPPLAVYRGELSPQDYLSAVPSQKAGQDRGVREMVLEEMLLLSFANSNPAFLPYRELFDDSELRRTTAFGAVISSLQTFFLTQPNFGDGKGAGGGSLIEILFEPARRAPRSLQSQLEFLLERWRGLLGEDFVRRILRSIDFVREEALRRTGPGGFTGSAPVLSFASEAHEYERFSLDREWMPRLVLLAKNAYVWLEQLSRLHQRSITRLDQIPEEELFLLEKRGFTGLWLIGLWERSRASKQIKMMMGSPDAVASAYSLMNYEIADDLGGWEALNNLRSRAWQHGIRLSADMVPNHMGIDSRWVIEHPDWFLSLPYPPYPNYTFNGADLSGDDRVGIFLEDHYYDRADAAVVFKRIDRWTGDARYIYHGNDGTSMPWNDTAQLDYSKVEVRKAVIQTILHVARNFPIIRFDAAMTLVRKHIQRLWFPEPGGGGAIPSRAEHGLTRAEFEAAVPGEFWREVVDRVASEVPDTLLLAEAFWLMEGYFVRTLGMHRVYNSAFMHMLRDEKNADYRQVIKNILEFDPQVLKRFVNFMNNPDEKTAVEQFGKADKYFGVCVLLSTLPGLPMFGHGQVEGFSEKYGMEYRRPKWDESPDEGFIRYHDQVIFPLLHRRYLFAEVDHFFLYDVFTADGHVNEDVFAYSNRHGGERSLVVYHNKYADARGWVKTSAAFMDKGAGKLLQRSLSEGLGIPDNGFAIFKDSYSGLEFIRACRTLQEEGLYIELGGYQCHVFLDWRFVDGEDWRLVSEEVKGAGIPSIQEKYDLLHHPPTATESTTPAPSKIRRSTKRTTGSKKSPTPGKKAISTKKKAVRRKKV